MTESTRSKGSETRRRIVERAFVLASTVGLEGFSIGALASDLGISKSGLFAHFRSKEQLQLDVLTAAADHFKAKVFTPALSEPRGKCRLLALFDAWLLWVHDEKLPGGCVFLAAASEWDDRDGVVRDQLVAWFELLGAALVRATKLAVEESEFRRDLDVELFASELHGIVLKYHLESRLCLNKKAEQLARSAFRRLLIDAQMHK